MTTLLDIRARIQQKLSSRGARADEQAVSGVCTMLVLLHYDPEGIVLRAGANTRFFAQVDGLLDALSQGFAEELALLHEPLTVMVERMIAEHGPQGITEAELFDTCLRGMGVEVIDETEEAS
jgi:hypothetical protein